MQDGPKSDKTVSWEELRVHNSPNDLWVSIDGCAYDLSSWLGQHPGGALVLANAAGKDATQAFLAYHPARVRERLPALCVGCMTPRGSDHGQNNQVTENLTSKSRREPMPHSVGKNQDSHLQAAAVFDDLKRQIEVAGLMKERTLPYLRLMASLLLMAGLAVWFTAKSCVVPAALLIALFWQQAAFIGHDVGHSAVSHSRKFDSISALFVQAAVGIGISW